MSRARSGTSLALALGVALVLLANSTGGAHHPPQVPVTIEVDALPTIDADRLFLAFFARTDETARVQYQVGLAQPGTCAFRVLERGDPPPSARVPVPRPPWLAGTPGTDAGPPASPEGSFRPSGALFTCRSGEGHHPRAGDSIHREPGLHLGPVHRNQLQAGVPARLEATLRLVGEDPPSPEQLQGGRLFVRVWLEDSPDSVLVGLGGRYDPGLDAATHDRPTLATLNLTEVFFGVAVAGGTTVVTTNQRGKDWDVPLPWPLVWLFSRLHRSSLLEHGARRAIHDIVEASPGIRFGELRSRSGLASGVLTHHLRMLEAHGLVVTVRRGRQRHLYPVARRHAGEDGGGATQRQEEILGLLSTGRRTQSEVARRLGVSQQAVSYHLRRLAADGAVVRERGPTGSWVYTTRAP